MLLRPALNSPFNRHVAEFLALLPELGLGLQAAWDPLLPHAAPTLLHAPPCTPGQESGLSGGATLPKANFAQAELPWALPDI